MRSGLHIPFLSFVSSASRAYSIRPCLGCRVSARDDASPHGTGEPLSLCSWSRPRTNLRASRAYPTAGGAPLTSGRPLAEDDHFECVIFLPLGALAPPTDERIVGGMALTSHGVTLMCGHHRGKKITYSSRLFRIPARKKNDLKKNECAEHQEKIGFYLAHSL